MNTKYNYEKFQDLGFEIEMRKRISFYKLSEKVLLFTNRNDVTTISNWIGIGLGVVGLLVMVF